MKNVFQTSCSLATLFINFKKIQIYLFNKCVRMWVSVSVCMCVCVCVCVCDIDSVWMCRYTSVLFVLKSVSYEWMCMR